MEFVDEHGRKVRVNVTGHWADLNAQTVAIALAAFGQTLGLSDLEESE